MIFFYNERKSVLSFESFSNALKCKPVQDFLVPFYPNPLCDWVNALAIFKLPLFPICRDGLLSFLWCRNPWRQQVSPKIVMHSIDSNLTLSSQLEIGYITYYVERNILNQKSLYSVPSPIGNSIWNVVKKSLKMRLISFKKFFVQFPSYRNKGITK